jgi:hypothetical protein
MDSTWRKNYFRYKSYFLNMISQYRERSDWKAYLEILLSLATISVFSIFALKPTVLTIAKLIKDIDEKKQTIQKMDNKIQNLSKAQLIYDQERSNIALLEDSALPKSVSADVFARQMEGLSTKENVQLLTVSIDKALILGSSVPEVSSVLSEGAAGANFTIVVNADVDQYTLLANFLDGFSNLRRPLYVDKIEYKSELSQDKKNKNLTLYLTGQLPYLP